MAQTIATVSLCLFIVMIQHLYNWLFRKAFHIMEEDGMGASNGLFIAWGTVTLIVTIALFKLLIEINK